jgi:hypothetical protein
LSNTLNEKNVTKWLAQFVANSQWKDIPLSVRHEAKRAILNIIGCILGGCRDDVTGRALSVLDTFSGVREATVMGRSKKLDVLSAAYINAVSSNVLDFDDTHPRTVIHPTAPVAPALLALAERQRLSGPQLLHAFVLGVEVECRIGNSVTPWHYKHGFHITSTCGVFGSAAATAKILGLDSNQTAWALGNAATQASGLIESITSMSKSINTGSAARNGMFAAFLAECGFQSPDSAIEGRFGFGNVMCENPNFSEITDRLGETWELMQNAYKPYPTGVVLHPVIDACLELRDRHAIDSDCIDRIEVTGNPLLCDRADRPTPKLGREAKLSVHHSCAVAFIHGAAGQSQFSDSCVNDPAVITLRDKVVLNEDAAVSVGSAFVTVHMNSGVVHTEHLLHMRGSAQRPMSDADLEGKFRDNVISGGSLVDAERLIDAIWACEICDDIGEIMKLTASSVPV